MQYNETGRSNKRPQPQREDPADADFELKEEEESASSSSSSDDAGEAVHGTRVAALTASAEIIERPAGFQPRPQSQPAQQEQQPQQAAGGGSGEGGGKGAKSKKAAGDKQEGAARKQGSQKLPRAQPSFTDEGSVVWREYEDKNTGYCYYHNRVSKQSMWLLPAGTPYYALNSGVVVRAVHKTVAKKAPAPLASTGGELIDPWEAAQQKAREEARSQKLLRARARRQREKLRKQEQAYAEAAAAAAAAAGVGGVPGANDIVTQAVLDSQLQHDLHGLQMQHQQELQRQLEQQQLEFQRMQQLERQQHMQQPAPATSPAPADQEDGGPANGGFAMLVRGRHACVRACVRA